MSGKNNNGIGVVSVADEAQSFLDDLSELLEEMPDDSNVRILDKEVGVIEDAIEFDMVEEVPTTPIIEAIKKTEDKSAAAPAATSRSGKQKAVELEEKPASKSVSVIPMPSRRSGEAKVGRAADALIQAASVSPAAAAAASKTVAGALMSVTMQMDTMGLDELSVAYSGGDALGAAAWVSQAAASYYAIQRGLQDWRNKQGTGVAAKPPMEKINAAVAEQFTKDANRAVSKSTVYAHARIWQTFFLGRKYVDPSTETDEEYNPWQALHILVSRAYFEYALLAPDNLQIPLLGIMVEKKIADPKYSVKDAYEDAQKVRSGISIDAVAAGEGEVVRASRRTVSEFDLAPATIAGQVGADATDYLVAIYSAAKGMGKMPPPASGQFRAVYIWRAPDGRWTAHDQDMDAAESARIAAAQGRSKPIYTIIAQDDRGDITVVNAEGL